MAVTHLLPESPGITRPGLRELDALAARIAPVTLAADRCFEVPGLTGALPAGVRRGTVVRVSGAPGSGATGVALRLAAAVTRGGEWAVAVDPDGTLGGLAALEAGVAADRFAVVRGVGRERWPVVVGALLDGVTGVVAEVPVGVRFGDARRLVARVRERRGLLVVLESRGVAARAGTWPGPAAHHVHTTGGAIEVTGKAMHRALAAV
jgi:hypothetical protein